MNIQRICKNLTKVTTILFTMFATIAHAQAQQAPAPGGESAASNSLASIVMLVAFGLIFYFMVFRPQSRRAQYNHPPASDNSL